MKYKYSLTETYFQDMPELLTAMISSTPKEKPNRSIIGKKAYRTFLKNGGSRNSKGQFSKKEKIDWEKIEKDMLEAYINTPLSIQNNIKGHTKAYAKVFQKHGLIDKGVEI